VTDDKGSGLTVLEFLRFNEKRGFLVNLVDSSGVGTVQKPRQSFVNGTRATVFPPLSRNERHLFFNAALLTAANPGGNQRTLSGAWRGISYGSLVWQLCGCDVEPLTNELVGNFRCLTKGFKHGSILDPFTMSIQALKSLPAASLLAEASRSKAPCPDIFNPAKHPCRACTVLGFNYLRIAKVSGNVDFGFVLT